MLGITLHGGRYGGGPRFSVIGRTAQAHEAVAVESHRRQQRSVGEYGGMGFLAGGLDPQNVSEAIKLIDPYGLDVSSGIETDGFKDPLKMEAFMANVRKDIR